MLTFPYPSPFSTYILGLVLSPQFDYNNGVGSKVDRFDIDLYMADGTGDCGTYVTSICDKESIGCKDSSKYSVSCNLSPTFIRTLVQVHVRSLPPRISVYCGRTGC